MFSCVSSAPQCEPAVELVRGDEQQALREFYAELLHTSSTHAGFEYAIRPWGTRDFEGNLAPHALFAADCRNLLRNMLVWEQGRTMHLLLPTALLLMASL